jgi:glucose-1-phosphate thymidylyltransferase
LENLRAKGLKFIPGEVDEWLDCGNKNITVQTHRRILAKSQDADFIANTAVLQNSIINHPCFIGENVKINNSVVGPYVSIEENTVVNDSIITNTIIQSNSAIENICMHNSMIGNHAKIVSSKAEFSIGDYNEIEMK